MLLDHRLHLFSPCARPAAGTSVQLDLGAFAERLLTFERYTIHASQCAEVEGIVAALGLTATQRLIETEVIRICDGAASVASPARDFPTRPRPLPPLHYSLHLALRDDFDEDPTRSKVIDEHVARLQFRGAHHGASKAFKRVLRRKIVGMPNGLGDVVPAALGDLRQRKDLLRLAIAAQFGREGIGTAEFDLEVTGEASLDDPLRVSTDLDERLGIAKARLHTSIEHAVLAVARLSQEIAFMRGMNAVGALPQADVPLFRAKLDSLVQSDERSVRSQLTRILQIADFPDVASAANAGRLDMRQLVALRGTDDAKEFRKWLRQADLYSDEDLKRLLGGLRARLALLMGTTPAKLAFITFCTILPLPFSQVVGMGAGVAAALLDSFVLQKLFSAPGPALFVQRLGRSLFSPDERFETSPEYQIPSADERRL